MGLVIIGFGILVALVLILDLRMHGCVARLRAHVDTLNARIIRGEEDTRTLLRTQSEQVRNLNDLLDLLKADFQFLNRSGGLVSIELDNSIRKIVPSQTVPRRVVEMAQPKSKK